MKNFIVLCIASLLFTACKKDKPSASAPLAPPAPLTYDGYTYKTVRIGTQVWMAENLRSTHYQNGIVIADKNATAEWVKATEGYCNPLINGMNVSAEYGKLYNWYALTDPRNIAPAGWRVPTQDDFNKLITASGGEVNASNALREKGTSHWTVPNTGATNSTGFTAFSSPSRSATGNFSPNGSATFFISSSIAPNSSIYILFVNLNTTSTITLSNKIDGISVRLIKE